MKVTNKVIVVTGGGNGVGRELVLCLLSRGAKVAAVDINQRTLDETVRMAGEYRTNLSSHIVNVADKEAVERLPAEVIAIHGAVDGIINNAGIIHPFGDLIETGYDTIARVMDINFYGTLYMIKAFLPHLSSRPEAHIANMSSMGALFSVPGQTVYGASKAGVKIITEGLRSELSKTKIRVTVVFPGGIGTNILEHSGVKASQRMEHLRKVFRLLTPKKAARRIVNGIERNRYRLTLGIDAGLIDIVCRLSPSGGSLIVHRMMKSVIQG